MGSEVNAQYTHKAKEQMAERQTEWLTAYAELATLGLITDV